MATKPPPTAEVEPSETPQHKSTHAGIVRSAGIVSAAVLLSRITGLVREVVLAHFFGASMVFDAFLAAFRIPNLMRDLLAEGALSAAFVTTFSQELSSKGDEAAFRLSNLLASVLVPMLAVLCLFGVIFAPQLVDVMFPGFGEVPGKKELTVQLARIMMPFLLFIALAAKAMGVLNAKGRFGLPALASAFFNITSLAVGLSVGFLLGPRLGFEPITGMAVGTLLGGLVQYICQVPSMRRIGLRFRPIFDLSDPGLRQVMRLMGPAILGAGAVQINIVVNSIFASQITNAAGVVIDGPVSWLGYAFRFMQLPLGLFGVAIASATLPAISRSAVEGRIADFRDTLSRSLGLVFLFTIPSAAGLVVLSRPIIGLLFQRGEFTATDTEQTAVALSYYCVGLAGYAAIKVLTPAYYALNDVRIPVLTSIVSIAVNYILNWGFIRILGWGHAGLAFSTSLVATCNFLVLFWLMRNKAGGIDGRRLLASVVKISVASALMAAACWLCYAAIEQRLGESGLGRLVVVMVALPLGLFVLYGACRWMKVNELNAARQAVLDRLRGPARAERSAKPYDRIDRNGF
ncbi:MAG: murein biosynthesis integral membrane protein MurJ [Bryobacterales bacterium]